MYCRSAPHANDMKRSRKFQSPSVGYYNRYVPRPEDGNGTAWQSTGACAGLQHAHGARCADARHAQGGGEVEALPAAEQAGAGVVTKAAVACASGGAGRGARVRMWARVDGAWRVRAHDPTRGRRPSCLPPIPDVIWGTGPFRLPAWVLCFCRLAYKAHRDKSAVRRAAPCAPARGTGR